jgi:plastocyanin
VHATQAFAGEIVGTVVLTSKTSTVTPALILRDRHVCGATDPVHQGWLELTGNQLDGVLVHLDARPEKKRLRPKRIEIDQRNCTFMPRVVGATRGSKVRFTNSDPLLHNVHLFDPDNLTVANWAMPAKGQTTNWVVLKKPGRYRVGCDAGHAWMNAHVLVFDHRHFELSKGGGRFRLSGVPAGKHRLVAWHPDLGTREATVDVSAKGTTEVRFQF